jgi:hypothetical protein
MQVQFCLRLSRVCTRHDLPLELAISAICEESLINSELLDYGLSVINRGRIGRSEQYKIRRPANETWRLPSLSRRVR